MRYSYDGEHYDSLTRTGIEIAVTRSQHLDPECTALDRQRFMVVFDASRSAQREGRDDFHTWRALRNGDDSVAIAGYLEGLASARRNHAVRDPHTGLFREGRH